jgi:hypothetical protein
LLDVKRAAARINRSHMRDDHLGGKHCLQLVIGSNTMQQRQRETRSGGIEYLSVTQRIEQLLIQRLGDRGFGCPKAARKRLCQVSTSSIVSGFISTDDPGPDTLTVT